MMNKKFKNSVSFEEVITNSLRTSDDIKEFLNASLELYLEDNDFNGFYRSLEYVIKAQDNLSNFSKKAQLSRQSLYNIFNLQKEPKMQTIAKILKERGFTLKIA